MEKMWGEKIKNGKEREKEDERLGNVTKQNEDL